jgi:hypothetical protein
MALRHRLHIALSFWMIAATNHQLHIGELRGHPMESLNE